MKLKSLVKKFSYNEILKELPKQGWTLPTLKEVRESKDDIEYNVVWISDLPTTSEDRTTHALLYDVNKDEVELVNKMFQLHVAVVVIPKVCSNCTFNVGYCYNLGVPPINIDVKVYVSFGCTEHEFK